MAKRTKIICTIGPASQSEAVLSNLIKNGMNFARLNFSHGTQSQHKKFCQNIRRAASKAGKRAGIIADLQGPKIRIGELEKEIAIKAGQTIILTTGKGGGGKLPVTYKNLHRDLRDGEKALLDDGLIELKVERVRGRDIFCRVVVDGKLTSHKGMNFPDSKIRLSSLTAKDRDDLKFAMKEGVDFVAVSFVRSARDIEVLKRLIVKNARSFKVKKPRIIAKIEKGEALENFVEILEAADAIMIARGDLAIETPAEDLPLRQKEMIILCRKMAKPVIVATQMLDSMMRNLRPTRAEVSDVANAVMDHVDAVMLSGETAIGQYPREAVLMMNKIIRETEDSPYDDVDVCSAGEGGKNEGVGKSVNVLARETGAKQIVDLSGGDLYRYISQWRPEAEIFVKIKKDDFYPALFWGVTPFSAKGQSPQKLIAQLKRKGLLKKKNFILVSGNDRVEIID